MDLLLLADIIVVLHLLYVGFVVAGFLAVILGGALGWGWIRNRKFRFSHVAAMAFVGVEAAIGMVCPLTRWEYELRMAAGAGAEHGAFIARWAQQLLYYDLPPWVFTAGYLLLTALALALLWIVPVHARIFNITKSP